MIWINIAVALVCLLLGYLLGSFPTGVFIAKVFFGKDPREYGSGNTGGTNVGRLLGKKWGLITIVIDALKAGIAVWVVWSILTFTPLSKYMVWDNGYFAAPAYYWGAGLAAAIGHCYSIFLKFKGGKAVACYAGLNAVISWFELVVILTSFLVPLKIKKYVSLSSIILAIVSAISVWAIAIIGVTTSFNTDIFTWSFGNLTSVGTHFPLLGFEAAIVDTFLAVFLIIRHKENIARLKAGTERKITWMK